MDHHTKNEKKEIWQFAAKSSGFLGSNRFRKYNYLNIMQKTKICFAQKFRIVTFNVGSYFQVYRQTVLNIFPYMNKTLFYILFLDAKKKKKKKSQAHKTYCTSVILLVFMLAIKPI